MNPTYTLHYLRGLCAMLRDLQNGRVSHERDNLIQTLILYSEMIERGRSVSSESIKNPIERALDLLRKERTK